MPRGEPKDNSQKSRIDNYKRDKFLTPNQYKSLSWNHLDQIGKYNKDNQKKPKPGGDNSKSGGPHSGNSLETREGILKKKHWR